MDWRDRHHLTCVFNLVGATQQYNNVLCVVRAAVITRVRLQLREFLVEFRGSRVIEQEMARRLHSDLKW
jgi:trehalose-6-phosphatase